MRIDLHTHSTASDGTDTPAQLIATAAGAGLDVVALTDHDTTAGWAQAIAALRPGLTLVPGAEFSCVYTTPDDLRIPLHLLGYLFDPEHEALRAEQARLRTNRLGRGEQIVANLAAAGYPITWARVQALAGEGAVGRPHIARALVEQGVVATVGEAFEELLRDGSPYYVSKADTDALAAIRMVKDAGGVAVFAHPWARRRGQVVSEEAIAQFAAAGLDGLEVDHPDHAPNDRERLAELAGELGLFVTGSSDYHGTNKPTPIGACLTAEQQYERLLALPAAAGPITVGAAQ